MAYWDISQMATDANLQARINAAVAQEITPQPQGWTAEHMWQLAASPGWGDAWASAVAANNPAPGRDESVITDGMILSAVQSAESSG